MENQAKKYVIKDLYSDRDISYFVSDSTTSLEDIWKSGHFKDKNRKPNEDFKPKVFYDLKEAKRYLKEVKRLSNQEWKENGWINKIHGKSKSQWDIYEYIETQYQESK